MLLGMAVSVVLLAALAPVAAASPGRLWTGSMSSGVWESSAGRPGSGPLAVTVVEFSGYETELVTLEDGSAVVHARGEFLSVSVGGREAEAITNGVRTFDLSIDLLSGDISGPGGSELPSPLRLTIEADDGQRTSVLQFTAVNRRAGSPSAFKDRPLGPCGEPGRQWHLTAATGLFEPLAKVPGSGSQGVGQLPPGSGPRLPGQMWVGSHSWS
jgi:hypothetical protein